MVGYETQFAFDAENDCDDEWGLIDQLAEELEGSDKFTVVREVHGGQYLATIED